ncbi:hypothetical protein TJA_25040 [Thermus sp. LT1-2-5]
MNTVIVLYNQPRRKRKGWVGSSATPRELPPIPYTSARKLAKRSGLRRGFRYFQPNGPHPSSHGTVKRMEPKAIRSLTRALRRRKYRLNAPTRAKTV